MGTPDDDVVPVVHDRVAALLGVFSDDAPALASGRVYAMADAADPGAPIVVRVEGGACGGGRRVSLTGRGLAHVDAPGERPTHVLVRCVAESGEPVSVLVERGTRGIPVWPDGSRRQAAIDFETARMDAAAVVSGSPT